VHSTGQAEHTEDTEKKGVQGVLEKWSIGVMEKANTPALQYSTTPGTHASAV